MDNHTTLNVNISILKSILDAAEKTNNKRNYIIILLLRHAMKDYKELFSYCGLVRYQDRDPLRQWKTVHVWYSDKDAVFFHDMRRFYNLSVSYILRYAVNKYLKEIVEKLLTMNTGDNYHFDNYKYSLRTIDNRVNWRQEWIKTKKTIKKPEN